MLYHLLNSFSSIYNIESLSSVTISMCSCISSSLPLIEPLKVFRRMPRRTRDPQGLQGLHGGPVLQVAAADHVPGREQPRQGAHPRAPDTHEMNPFHSSQFRHAHKTPFPSQTRCLPKLDARTVSSDAAARRPRPISSYFTKNTKNFSLNRIP